MRMTKNESTKGTTSFNTTQNFHIETSPPKSNERRWPDTCQHRDRMQSSNWTCCIDCGKTWLKEHGQLVTSPLRTVLDCDGYTWLKCPQCWAIAPLGEDLPHDLRGRGCKYKDA